MKDNRYSPRHKVPRSLHVLICSPLPAVNVLLADSLPHWRVEERQTGWEGLRVLAGNVRVGACPRIHARLDRGLVDCSLRLGSPDPKPA
jgi:hypothetical protein